jgi:hypothetical protein
MSHESWNYIEELVRHLAHARERVKIHTKFLVGKLERRAFRRPRFRNVDIKIKR